MLELKDFIQKTLVDIIEGVYEAGDSVHSAKGYVVPVAHCHSKYDKFTPQNIEFDIALQVSESEQQTSTNSGKGDIGGKIFVASAKANITSENSFMDGINKETISRIKFTVPIAFKARLD